VDARGNRFPLVGRDVPEAQADRRARRLVQLVRIELKDESKRLIKLGHRLIRVGLGRGQVVDLVAKEVLAGAGPPGRLKIRDLLGVDVDVDQLSDRAGWNG